MLGDCPLSSQVQIELVEMGAKPNCNVSDARIAPMISKKTAPDMAGRMASLGYCLRTEKLAVAIDQPRDNFANIMLSVGNHPAALVVRIAAARWQERQRRQAKRKLMR